MSNVKELNSEELEKISGGHGDDKSYIKSKIIEVASKACSVNFSESNISVSFEQLGIDSATYFSMIMDIEDEFNINIDDDSFPFALCLNDLINKVLSMLRNWFISSFETDNSCGFIICKKHVKLHMQIQTVDIHIKVLDGKISWYFKMEW